MINKYSSFWNNDISSTTVDDFLGITEKKKGRDLIALAGYRRAIGNFVNIVTGKSIPVKFWAWQRLNTLRAMDDIENVMIQIIEEKEVFSFGVLWKLENSLPLSIQSINEPISVGVNLQAERVFVSNLPLAFSASQLNCFRS